MLTPLAFIAGLAAFLAFPRIHDNPVLAASFAGAALVLLAWYAVLWQRARAAGTPLRIEISLRPQHYLQAIAHTSIFVYWGMYWPPIQDAAVLIAAQIVFAYAFDMLLSWSRKNEFVLGFGPFPIIYSTNLFLRYRDDWFYMQFLMVAVGFLAKELIRWNRDGRRVHIFNPSSFPLALFSAYLIATNTSHITWAEDIATLLILPPYIYLFIFLVALPGQFLFGVTTMTLPAVLTTYAFSAVYLQLTGTYFFFDSNVPIAVFLGMHLLFTDPSTSPKTELGRILFGVTYGLTVVGLYWGLDAVGAPTYYDKLLQVPFMNLAVKWYDRIGRSPSWAWLNPARLGAALAPRARSAAYVTMWILAFGVMSRANGLGNDHPGQTVLFWDQACEANLVKACRNLAQMETRYCQGGSPWACNELAILGATDRVPNIPSLRLFGSACAAGFEPACANRKVVEEQGRGGLRSGDPGVQDFLLLLQNTKGPLADQSPDAVLQRACDQQWPSACAQLADQTMTTDKAKSAPYWERACDGGHGMSCQNLAVMHHFGDTVPKDDTKALPYLERACALGIQNSCLLAAEVRASAFGTAQPQPPPQLQK
jgi:TPR repeat protein